MNVSCYSIVKFSSIFTLPLDAQDPFLRITETVTFGALHTVEKKARRAAMMSILNMQLIGIILWVTVEIHPSRITNHRQKTS